MNDEDLRRNDDGGHVDLQSEMDDLCDAMVRSTAIAVAVLCCFGLAVLALIA